jgi:hypothetical protein
MEVVRNYRPENVLHYIVSISRFHRIQGSKGLVDAVEYVRDELSSLGLDPKLYSEKYDGKTWYLTLQSPVAWDLIEGEIRFGEKSITSEETPLVAKFILFLPSSLGESISDFY